MTEFVLIAAAMTVYVGVAALVIGSVWRRTAGYESGNKRLALRSFAIALFWAPSVSVPASLPVPALSMFVLWMSVVFQQGFDAASLYALLALGVAPIATLTGVIFGVARLSAGPQTG